MKRFSIHHGDHNASILSPDKLKKKLVEVPKNGIKYFDGLSEIGIDSNGNKEKGRLVVFGSKEEPLQQLYILTESKDKKAFTLTSSYPFITTGTEIEVDVYGIFEDSDNPFEGVIEARYDEKKFYFFDPLYFFNKEKYRIGEKHKIVLSGFLYDLCASEDNEMKFKIAGSSGKKGRGDGDITGGLNSVVFDLVEMGDFKPSDELLGVCDFESKIFDYQYFEYCGEEILGIGLEFCGCFFNAKDTINYFPAYIRSSEIDKNDIVKGEKIQGTVYFQGTLV